ncbi:hypothetical protein LAV76_26755 [Bacillus paramobilis]|uniref:hypothetical protein n=1 Tax=Bacillus paramobilis TaxID=2817477 RepID=UPI0030C9E358
MNNFKLGSEFDNLVSPLSDIELLNLFIQSCSQTKINGIPVLTFPSEEIQTGWHKTLPQAFPDINRAISDYESGNFVHSPTGAGDVRNSSFYGETVIPRTYSELPTN